MLDGGRIKRRAPKYLAWVREQRCSNCQAPGPSDPHHIKGAGHFGGVALKAPDLFTMPLCRRCHDALHAGEIERETQWEWIVRTQYRALAAGVLTVR